MKIPYSFIRQRVSLEWPDVLFGLEQRLISPNVAIERAVERLGEGHTTSADEIELAGLSESDPIREIVLRLANGENAPLAENVRAKWLYLALSWLFENRESVDDPLGKVEEIYSDFGYPREISSFVRYMPMVGPNLGNLELNEARLYTYWKHYIDEAYKRLGRSVQAE